MSGRNIGAMSLATRCLRAAGVAGLLAVAAAASPSPASADCEVPDKGVSDDTLLSSLGPNWASLDQLIWRLPGSEDAKGVALFGRVVGAPSDRNVVDFYADGGITFTGMVPRRPDDSLAIGFAYTGISSDANGFDRDLDLPVARNYEALLEICYTMQLKSGWSLQPDFQYIWQPGGNVPSDSGKDALESAAVFGARSTMSF